MKTWLPQIRRAALFAAAIVIALFAYREFIPADADLIVVNAVIHTMDDELSVSEAMAIRGDRIVGLGSNSAIRRKFRSSHLVDVGGKAVLPGLIDAHAHFISLGIARMTVDLVGTTSESDAVSRVRDRVVKTKPGLWVRGRGWDQNDWPIEKFPSHASLDRISAVNPVILSRIDGHAIWVNRAALSIAGITRATPDPPGGKIIKDANGDPSGVFVDNAKELITRFVPPPTDAEISEAIALANEECLSLGLTSVHDMGESEREINLCMQLIDAGKLHVRLYAAVGGVGETWDAFRRSGPLVGYGDNHLTVRVLKMYIDGALGSRGAALVDEYTDDPGNRGLTVTSESELQSAVDQAIESGFQVCTHAIGDRGNNIVLNVYERALAKHPGADRRLRIEHAQVLLASDIPRFSQLGVVPSMQPTHCTSDMYWADVRLGPQRIRGAYAWRSLLSTGVKILGGSDFPVESPNPMFGIYAAVTRQDQSGKPASARDAGNFQFSKRGLADSSAFNGGWYASQSMTREEAVRAFTSWAAWGAFEESFKGSLERGKLADFIVLSNDIFTVPAKEIFSTAVEQTFVGGKRVYQRGTTGHHL